jgi:small-conductance mechanosensitive channel
MVGDLRRLRTRAGSTPPVELVRRADFRRAFLGAALAIVVLVYGDHYGALTGHGLHKSLIAGTSAVVFLLLGIMATRSAAGEIYRLTLRRAGRQSAEAARLVIAFVGYVATLILALNLLDVTVRNLLVGGALTGVVLGIALQQSLGNIFAGIYLLLVRPFTVGDAIRVRSGALGGEFSGVVSGMSLTYVGVETDEGLLLVPNSGMLNAAIGPRPLTGPLAARRPTPAPEPAPEPEPEPAPEPDPDATARIPVVPEP